MKKQSFWRYTAIAAMLALIATSILVQIVRIQNSPEVGGVTGQGAYVWKTFYPARGEIRDRNGNLLAGNKTVFEIGVDLSALPAAKEAALKMEGDIAMAAASSLGMDPATALSRMTDAPAGTRYVILDDYVAPDQAAQLMTLQKNDQANPSAPNLDAINFTAHLMRSYPEKDLASNIIGYVTRDNHGYMGIEEKYDIILAGEPVTKLVPANPLQAVDYPQIEPGQTLILTIDREIQASIEKILDDALVSTGASSGTIIVMDPKTGEILGMTSSPRMDLNDYTKVNQIFTGETPYNRAISEAYEPGSVAKIFTMSAALDTGTVKPGTIFLDTGTIIVGGVAIHDWNDAPWGYQDMTGCLANSLNVCLAWVSTKMGNNTFYSYMQKFGLGQLTGIDLAGEVAGREKHPGDTDWTPVELGTNAFGQGEAITPIQMVTAASALANGGQMVSPHVLLAQVRDGHQSNMLPHVIGNPISADTAHTISNMLYESLQRESSTALLDGYPIAGKTGTAQIPTSTGYDPDNINASFIGWGPVADPRFLVYVWLEKPQTNKAASVVAAPIFKQVIQKLVILMGIPPEVAGVQNNGQ
ncbi:MAG TPA: penicillin-binding protein 2 [Anaerolineales bacterium]|nr:penicillin-binding protein 2 [Anaerolineales bacterium]